MARCAVVNYGSGNIFSLMKSLQRVAGAEDEIILADSPGQLKTSTHLILPGVGAFGACMRALDAGGMGRELRKQTQAGGLLLGICVGMQMLFEGSEEDEDVEGLGLLSGKLRHLNRERFKTVPTGGKVNKTANFSAGRHVAPSGGKPEERKKQAAEALLSGISKVPHMGWSRIDTGGDATPHPVLADGDGHWFYFAHSYALEIGDCTLARCDIGPPFIPSGRSPASSGDAARGRERHCFSAAVGRRNVLGTQFHPEKSGESGLNMLRLFLSWKSA